MTAGRWTESHDGSAVWLDVVAAVDYLSSGPRPGLTVWVALAEAVDQWTVARLDEPATLRSPALWDDPDPLRSAVDRLMNTTGGPGTIDGSSLGDVLDVALECWLREMADLYNDGYRFAHPQPRNGWPCLVDALDDRTRHPDG